MAKLDIGISTKAISFPFRKFGTLLGLGLIPALITVGAIFIAFAIFSQLSKMPPTMWFLGLVLSVSISVVYLMLVSIFAVGIHRLIVRGEKPGVVIFRFGRYELVYAAVVVFFILASTIVEEALGRITSAYAGGPSWLLRDMWVQLGVSPIIVKYGLAVLYGVVLFVVIWISVRLGLALPHAAVAGRFSLRQSWEATRGNFWRLVATYLVLLIVSLLIYIPFFFFFFIMQTPPGFTFMPIMIATMVLVYTMFIALLSYAYQELVEERPASA
jgi:hypothetical protein